ncbi:hypothetical protein SAMN02910298_01978 [Pseudobutyrivibrio sp. YE44]|uniref:zinc-ribbon domain-containing protein n=1 Tax=Pseudobutyrivibrio sp. YE44 TaxID=1520802 RepID=UPI00088352A6|nr:zinc-ribbon domain-containing protein [Pseudobutyrivibrio sp. YE44]SDB40350.1 hypothetical protein SAMN02910298_01978 [Pseudobutyrivibrio sp. YE44]
MFIIKGFKKYNDVILTIAHEEQCMNCCYKTKHRIIKYSEYFTLFFIPIFPVSIKYKLACPRCTYEIRIKHSDIKHYKDNKGAAELSAARIEKYVE